MERYSQFFATRRLIRRGPTAKRQFRMNIFLKKFSNMPSEQKHLVFVYGTLKRGEPNHDLIEQRSIGDATFVGNAKTVKLWPLVIASRYNIPYLLYCEGKGEYIFLKIFSNMPCEQKHLVFVYGTLKRGEPNHDLIEQRTVGDATFVGNAKTVKLWPLVIASRYNLPYILYCEGKGKHICGEIYEVNDAMLARLDELENHPDYYTRFAEEVHVVTENGVTILKPWIYFLKNFRSELLSLPFLSDYSSKGSHGLEYVSRNKGPTGKNYYSDVMNL